MHLKSVSAAAALALLSTAAVAADLPSRRAPPVYLPPPPVPSFTWTGLYAGVHAGYQFGTSSSVIPGLAAGTGNPNGVVGGGHVGYLFATPSIPFFGGGLGNSLVFGVEGDVDGSNYKNTYGLGALTAGSRENIQGSARGRIGIAVDRVLFYATGGAAFGSLTDTYSGLGGFDSLNHTKIGWTAGGGVEYAITNNWSIRAEYRYTDYGTVTDALTTTVPGAFATRRETDSRVQAGISYKFDTFSPAAPVVARY